MVRMLEAEQLESVAEKLKQEFNIRMLAVDNELNFVFEVRQRRHCCSCVCVCVCVCVRARA
jgi:hypothetical protein